MVKPCTNNILKLGCPSPNINEYQHARNQAIHQQEKETKVNALVI